MLVLVGLCMGSFVEATSWRLHEQTKRSKLTKKQKQELSITKGRSMCAHCKHQLAWYDLLPLLSWVSLRGKCRYCQKPIGWHAPALELTTAALFAISYLSWPYVLGSDFGLAWVVFGLWLLCVVLFVLLSVYDLRWMLLPDRVVLVLVLTAFAYAAFQQSVAGVSLDGFISIVSSVAVSSGLFWVLYQVSGGKWIGGGDVKLGVALGLLIGAPLPAMLMLFLASLMGTLVALPLLIKAKSKQQLKIPFGPFLMSATFVVVIYGERLIDWYTNTVLLV